MLKMPGPISVISVPGDKKDALICADKIYQEAAAAADHKPLAAEAPGGKKRTKPGKCSGAHSGKRTSSECCATVEDAPSSSTGKSKKTMAAPPTTKKVPKIDAKSAEEPPAPENPRVCSIEASTPDKFYSGKLAGERQAPAEPHILAVEADVPAAAEVPSVLVVKPQAPA